ILDASDQCNTLAFTIGSSTGVTREWSIKVTQYTCGDLDAGPPGCLQYLNSESGDVASFNFRTDSAAVPITATHLADQHYSICFRRGANKCRICYSPHVNDPTADADTALSPLMASVSPVMRPQSPVWTRSAPQTSLRSLAPWLTQSLWQPLTELIDSVDGSFHPPEKPWIPLRFA
ncbi:Putative LOC100745028, partial [Caligus rogercresseyi]